MELVAMILLWACGLAALLLTGIWKISSKPRSTSTQAKRPPSPPAWPVLGHLHLLGKLPHQSLAELARRHGPHLMSVRLGSIPTLVVSSPQAAKLILQTHDHIFASRPQPAAPIHDVSAIALTPTSPFWRRMRALCTSDLFTNTRIRSFKHIRQAEMHALLRSLCAKQGEVMTMRPMLLATSLNMVARMVIGQRLSDLATGNKALSDFPDLMCEAVQMAGVFNWGDFLPFLARFDVQGLQRRLKMAAKRTSAALQVVLDTRRAQRKADDQPLLTKDFLDVLLAVPDIEDAEVKAVVMDMFIGGSDSTSTMVEWVLAELLANPNALSTLQEELDQVVGKSRLVEEEDIQNLPYLDAVIKESMRLHPPGPLLIPRESIEACEVCNYFIPAKTRVIVNVWAIGRDPFTWENPLKFDPKRFMPKGRYNQVNPHGQSFELLPFGSGRRICPALYLGTLNVQLMVAILLQCFDWSLALSKSKDPIDFSEEFGLVVSMASPLTITLLPRIDASFYKDLM